MRTRDFILLSALNASLAFGLLLYAVATWWREPPPIEARDIAQWNPADSFLSAQPGSASPSVTLNEALNRPLFQKNRRPFVPQAIVAEPAPAPQPVVEVTSPPIRIDASQLLLKGLLLTPDQGKALIATADAPDGVWVEAGAIISGWTVKSLDPQGVLLASGDSKSLLKLYVDKPSN